MAGLAETTAALARLRARPVVLPFQTDARLKETKRFGANPGALRMWSYVPADLPPRPALVVVLHGCTQTAAGYAAGAGWLDLAERYGFGVLCPEQVSANNLQVCFNWFQPEDTRRGHGEAASIKAMIDTAVRQSGADPKQIYVTGLSAGGAMTSVMLAAYPEIFAGGGIVAGLAYGAADTLPTALTAMFQSPPREGEAWGGLVRRASDHAGPWPKISIWHGTADQTVVPPNGGEIAKQWVDVHGAVAAQGGPVAGHTRSTWTVDGQTVVELYEVRGLGHGTPLASTGADGFGTPGPFLLEAGISSSLEMLRFWGVETGQPRARTPSAKPDPSTEPLKFQWSSPHKGGVDIQAIITKALTAAGLMKGPRR
jgi:poly(hydroxyalkanoate) depolymerase family esterase